MKLSVEHSSGNHWYVWVKTYRHCWLLPDGTITTDSLAASVNNWKSQQEAQQFLDNWMPQKEQLKIYNIKYYATLSEKEALDCSIEHWKQNVLDVEEAHLGSSYCAICLKARTEKDKAVGCGRHGGCCRYCILNDYKNPHPINCCKEYEAFVGKRTEENAIAMLNKLVLIRNKKYGNFYEEKKMGNKIVFDDGKEVELSKETTERLRKELVKPPYQFKAGDVAKNPSVWIDDPFRIIIDVEGELKSYDRKGRYFSTGQKAFERENYQKIGELKDFIN